MRAPGDQVPDDAARGVGAWLAFMEAAGIDLAVGDGPRAWTAPRHEPVPARVAPEPRPLPIVPAPAGAVAADDARRLAAQAGDMRQLEAVVRDFEACPLRRTAMNLCFGDGDPTSPLMLIGEAPGAEEDRQGKPFVGPSGRLLDRMLDAAGRPRSSTWITNTVYWRPPGNRSPTAQELAMCLPFLERQIELIRPKVILFVGGIAVRALLGVEEGVTRLRGRVFRYRLADASEVPATVMFHPAYLLRRPQNKGLAWRDMLQATAMLEAS